MLSRLNPADSVPTIYLILLTMLVGLAARISRRNVTVVRVPARYESIRVLNLLLIQVAANVQFGDKELFECRLALDEACVNIIEHAYGNDPSGMIEITLLAQDGSCTICLRDFGESYNPVTISNRAKASGIVDAEPGGLGLILMQTAMDEVRYTAGPGSNSLVMVKRGPLSS